MPVFAIEGGYWLALARGVSVTACLSVLGVLVFRLIVAPPALAGLSAPAVAGLDRRWRRLMSASTTVAVLGGGVWLALGSFEMAGRVDLAAVLQVAQLSRFGNILALRLALLAAVPMVVGRTPRTPRLAAGALLAAVAVGLQSMIGHAAGMGWAEKWLILSMLLHVLAAGLWLGQLLPLWSYLASAPPAAASLVLRRFSPLGLGCVVVLATTAAAQGAELVGGIGQFLGTAYGWTALVKLLLFCLLSAIAALNRFRLMPRQARRALSLSILVETLLGALVILAAAVLSSLPPAMHVQPVWRSFEDPLTQSKDAPAYEIVMAGFIPAIHAVPQEFLWKQ